MKRIDEENSEFFKQVVDAVEKGKCSTKDIWGFDLKSPVVSIPRVPCAHTLPSSETCKMVNETYSNSIFSLAPIYNTLIYPVARKIEDNQITEATFEIVNKISLKNFITFVETGHIVPYFPFAYSSYNPDLLRHFLEPGLPRISAPHMSLISLMGMCKTVQGECERCKKFGELARKDIEIVNPNDDEKEKETCSRCLSKIYSMGINRDKLFKAKQPDKTICALVDIIASRNMNAAVKTNCPIAEDALSVFAGFSNNEPFDAVVKGLKVNYSYDLDLANYLDFLDSKTTQSVREITQRILEDPFAAKYSERLNSKIVELNKEIGELGKSRAAKFYQAVSDIAVYGGSKYAQLQTGSLIKPKKRDLNRVSEWLASKFLDLHAKATGKDWTIAQIYRTQQKIEKCKKNYGKREE